MPKVYVVLGLGVLYFFLVFFNIAAEFLVNTIGFIVPAYYSLHALFTAGSADDTQVRLTYDAKTGVWSSPVLTLLQWLTYWVVYAFLTVLESTINAVYWFRMCNFFPVVRISCSHSYPAFYYTFKFIAILWMALPQTR